MTRGFLAQIVGCSLVLAGCGGAAAGITEGLASSTGTGTVEGETFPASGSLFAAATPAAGGGSETLLLISTAQSICALETAGGTLLGVQNVTVHLANYAAGQASPATTTGAYQVIPSSAGASGPAAIGLFATSSSKSCTAHQGAIARFPVVSGTITLETVDAGRLAGTFELHVGSDPDDKLVGSFAALPCKGFDPAKDNLSCR